jgi:exonuclease VII large subunit
LAVLKRGYAVVTKNNDELVKDINNVTIGEVVQIRLQNGKMTSVIASKEIDHGEQ